jgi:hypothetical protein
MVGTIAEKPYLLTLRRRDEMELRTIKNNIWYSTTGETLLEECDIITNDEGKTFYCNTHKKELFCGECKDRV